MGLFSRKPKAAAVVLYVDPTWERFRWPLMVPNEQPLHQYLLRSVPDWRKAKSLDVVGTIVRDGRQMGVRAGGATLGWMQQETLEGAEALLRRATALGGSEVRCVVDIRWDVKGGPYSVQVPPLTASAADAVPLLTHAEYLARAEQQPVFYPAP